MTLPRSTTYAVIGAGVHGLSTAWHLAEAVLRPCTPAPITA